MALNIADLFEHAVDAFPERLAAVCGDAERTYAQLEERTNRLAHYLASKGVGPGDNVGVYGRNSMELVETILAIYKLRAVFININYRYVAGELKYLLNDAECVFLVADRTLAEQVALALPETPTVKGVVVIDNGDGDFAAFGGVDYEEALAQSSPERDFGERFDDDVYMLYTGGTTGMPKGVVWHHSDVWRALGGGIDHVSGEVLPDEWAPVERGKPTQMTRLSIAPLIHGSAQWSILPSLFQGETVVVMPKFDAHAIWRSIDKYKVNVLVLVGDAMGRPLIEAYLAAGSYDGSSLWSISTNAATFSPSVKEQYVAAFPNAVITEAIGSSEMGFVGLGFKAAGPASDGPRVSPGPHTIIADEELRKAAPGVVGRLGRGVYIPQGYYKDPAKTAALFAEVDGVIYAFAGDWARYDEDGTIVLLGRGNTSINTGGEKVYPEEVEAAIKSHPSIFDAIVVGVPDERLGQTVGAIVQARPGETIDVAALQAHVRTLIAGYKVPRALWVVAEVGRTVSGKPDYAWAQRLVASTAPTEVKA